MRAPVCFIAVLLMVALQAATRTTPKQWFFRRSVSTAAPTEGTSNAQSTPGPESEIRPIADDEIEVDDYVMKPECAARDAIPGALKNERWLVKIRMVNDGRATRVQVVAQWNKLRETIGSKSDTARANIAVAFGLLRLSDGEVI
jgi:hypothetical protein